MKSLIIKITIFIISFLLLDFFFGSFFFHNEKKKLVYEDNDNFLFGFKKNLDLDNYNYGNLNYRLCTNDIGGRDACGNNIINNKNFDYVFIGDSFTEGLGINFNDTFFGLLKNKFKNKDFLNLAVSGYSSSIYYNKLRFFYENGYNFSEIFIFLDTSDIFDEIYRYKNDLNNKTSFNFSNEQINDLLDDNKRLIKNIYYKFPTTFFLLNFIFDLIPRFEFIDKYYLNLMINHNFGKWSYGKSDLFNSENIKKSLSKNRYYVEKIINIAKINNSKITFVIYPWPGHLYSKNIDNIYNKYWSDFFRNRNEQLLNLNISFFELLKTKKYEETILKYYIPGDVHFNKNGHKLIFQQLDNFISLNQKGD
jgi:hypothetical protein